MGSKRDKRRKDRSKRKKRKIPLHGPHMVPATGTIVRHTIRFRGGESYTFDFTDSVTVPFDPDRPSESAKNLVDDIQKKINQKKNPSESN